MSLFLREGDVVVSVLLFSELCWFNTKTCKSAEMHKVVHEPQSVLDALCLLTFGSWLISMALNCIKSSWEWKTSQECASSGLTNSNRQPETFVRRSRIQLQHSHSYLKQDCLKCLFLNGSLPNPWNVETSRLSPPPPQLEDVKDGSSAMLTERAWLLPKCLFTT